MSAIPNCRHGQAVAYRVKKSETTPVQIIKPDGLDYCLDCWKSYMGKDDRDLSASRMQFNGGADEEKIAYESNVNDDQRKADGAIGAATDAMIESMTRLHSWAIYRMCSITTQWNYPNANYIEVVQAACDDLRKKLKNNIATGTLF